MKDFVCINCMSRADSLYTTYSKEVVRLTECKTCFKPVDKYIEYDIVLIIIDLILQYLTAYRHLLLNVNFQGFSRLTAIFIMCDAYDKWIKRRSTQLLYNQTEIYYIDYQFYQSLVQSISEMFIYSLSIYIVLYFFNGFEQVKWAPENKKFITFINLTQSGFYGKVFCVFSIVWKLHHHWSYRLLTKLFLLISHIQVQRTLFPKVLFIYNCLLVAFGVISQQIVGYLINFLFDQIGY